MKASKRPAARPAAPAPTKGKKAGKPARKAVPEKGARTTGRTRAKTSGTTGKSTARPAKRGTRAGASKGVGGARKAVGRTAKKGVGAKGAKPRPLALVKGSNGRAARLEPVARYAIKELDPLRKCGASTSVQFLYRVDETVEGRTTPHLVFFDHHGWYCEHGRACPAVAPAKKYNGHIARVS